MTYAKIGIRPRRAQARRTTLRGRSGPYRRKLERRIGRALTRERTP